MLWDQEFLNNMPKKDFEKLRPASKLKEIGS